MKVSVLLQHCKAYIVAIYRCSYKVFVCGGPVVARAMHAPDIAKMVPTLYCMVSQSHSYGKAIVEGHTNSGIYSKSARRVIICAQVKLGKSCMADL